MGKGYFYIYFIIFVESNKPVFYLFYKSTEFKIFITFISISWKLHIQSYN